MSEGISANNKAFEDGRQVCVSFTCTGTVTLCDPWCTCYAKPGRRQHVWGCSFKLDGLVTGLSRVGGGASIPQGTTRQATFEF